MSISNVPPVPPEPVTTGLRGRCPRCGKGGIFNGFLKLKKACPVCGLDLGFADSADGPAFFAMTFIGFLIAGAAVLVELAYSPPFWVHILLWPPAIIFFALILLRPLKGLAIALQFANKAKEGEIDRSAR
ncbi:DUF983 domain-containing protein [Afifella sp. IM 167]|uniref:DUF983 domain-containing protein n=1 Tax=Afifella sp. IM 167 TaxID=2033586 RepID=UPI001CCFA4CB|nr:DUF983 domain-containing protein [Afifella sp. IM 167]